MSNDSNSRFKRSKDSEKYAEGANSEFGKRVKNLRKYDLRTDRRKKKNQKMNQSEEE